VLTVAFSVYQMSAGEGFVLVILDKLIITAYFAGECSFEGVYHPGFVFIYLGSFEFILFTLQILLFLVLGILPNSSCVLIVDFLMSPPLICNSLNLLIFG